MLRLQKISIIQFKNYLSASYNFSERVVGIHGNNGLGKTNLLDAIYYLCFTKSYFTKSESANVHHGMQGLRVEGNFVKHDQQEKVVCIVRENNKKEISRNGEDYKKFSNHIGQFPAVIIAPDDVELVIGNSDIRRKFLDTLLSQLDPNYLQWLIDYNKILQQRNSLLKSSAEKGYLDEGLLEILNDQLVQPGTIIYNKRKEFLSRFLPAVADAYQQIAGVSEPVRFTYYSPLHEDNFANLLNIFRQKDMLLQRTTLGIHKDDIEIEMHGKNFKNIASQGQRKSLLFALKLTEFLELKHAKGFAPLLLLDDVFEKLDADRMNNLLYRVCVENDGQVFITDTHRERLQLALQQLQVPFQLIGLE
ncbi:DNA replication/repair protein RecF [Aridibaculum aurantiacum]|uniref:DNA replication/repair protein RecF n=1 Tax=Aridibaculum aurantiacum TaxID=2810307 RepID=UPI001A9652B8|nr:DNA replication and repair protein RecF [Aridibaculum aurantiacum]